MSDLSKHSTAMLEHLLASYVRQADEARQAGKRDEEAGRWIERISIELDRRKGD